MNFKVISIFAYMKISKERLDDLINNVAPHNAVAQELVNFYNDYHSDPAMKFYYECTKTVEFLVNDMKAVRTGDIIDNSLLDADDKKFDRVFKILTEGEKIQKGLKIGRELTFTEISEMDAIEEDESKGSKIERMLVERNKKHGKTQGA